jgi:hypothetical protein
MGGHIMLRAAQIVMISLMLFFGIMISEAIINDTYTLSTSAFAASDDLPEMYPDQPGRKGHGDSIRKAVNKYKRDEQQDSTKKDQTSSSGSKKSGDFSD